LDLNLLGLGGLGFGEVLGAGQGAAPAKQLTAEDYQLLLGIERVRVPELLMQPAALAGVDQAGLPEVVGLVLRRLPRHVREAVAAGGVVVTGGNALFAGGWVGVAVGRHQSIGSDAALVCRHVCEWRRSLLALCGW
jgi:hypothetical protein